VRIVFYEHDGLEWRSLHSALRLNLREARVIAGGSTITQQLAKNLFLTKERTLSRKLKEAALTFELERLLPKQRILELYLNSIEYGMNQRGVGAAARYYFGKTPSELSLPESALLAGLVSRPPHSLSLYELAVSERTALNLIKIRWIDRYWEADFERAAAIPLNRLLRLPSDATRATENGLDQQTQASSLSPILPPWYWPQHFPGVCSDCRIRSENTSKQQPRRSRCRTPKCEYQSAAIRGCVQLIRWFRFALLSGQP